MTLALAACSDSGTGVDLTIDGPGLTVDELLVTARFDGSTIERRLTPPAPVALPSRLVASLPARALDVTFDVSGRLGGVEVGAGRSAPISVAAHTIVPGSVTLGPTRAISVVGESHGANRDRSSYTLAVASLGAAPGDLMLLFYFSTAGTVATPSGFTPVASGSGLPGTSYLVYQKRVNDPVEATVTVTNSAGTPPHYSAATLVVFRGVRAGDPFDARTDAFVPIIGTEVEPEITFSAPSITATRADGYHLVAFAYESGGGESWLRPPPGMVTLVEDQELVIFGQPLAASGATGTRAAVATWAAGNGTEGGAFVAALAPE